MTTATWSSRVRHDSDATYREWRDELITKLGLMVSAGELAADETNITPGAGSRPGTNTEQGYAVYHLADSLHSTAPVYIRFGFGTYSSGATVPRLQVTVGTSTNGSGVLGGTALSTAAIIHNITGQTVDTTRNSYLCVKAGFLGLSWKQGATGDGFFFINRTCDSAGAITATGSLAYWGNGNTSLTKSQAFRYASPATAFSVNTTSLDAMLGFNPQRQSSTLVGSDIQVFLGWTITPAVAPLFGVCGVLGSEVNTGSTFSCTLVGTTPRTYIALNNNAGSFDGGPPGSTYPKFAMLWE